MADLRGGRAGGRAGGRDARLLRRRGRARARGRGRAAPQLRGAGKGGPGAAAGRAGGGRAPNPRSSASAGGPHGEGGARPGGGNSELLPCAPLLSASTVLLGPSRCCGRPHPPPPRRPGSGEPETGRTKGAKSRRRDAEGAAGEGRGGGRTKALLREAGGLVSGRLPGRLGRPGPATPPPRAAGGHLPGGQGGRRRRKTAGGPPPAPAPRGSRALNPLRLPRGRPGARRRLLIHSVEFRGARGRAAPGAGGDVATGDGPWL